MDFMTGPFYPLFRKIAIANNESIITVAPTEALLRSISHNSVSLHRHGRSFSSRPLASASAETHLGYAPSAPQFLWAEAARSNQIGTFHRQKHSSRVDPKYCMPASGCPSYCSAPPPPTEIGAPTERLSQNLPRHRKAVKNARWLMSPRKSKRRTGHFRRSRFLPFEVLRQSPERCPPSRFGARARWPPSSFILHPSSFILHTATPAARNCASSASCRS